MEHATFIVRLVGAIALTIICSVVTFSEGRSILNRHDTSQLELKRSALLLRLSESIATGEQLKRFIESGKAIDAPTQERIMAWENGVSADLQHFMGQSTGSYYSTFLMSPRNRGTCGLKGLYCWLSNDLSGLDRILTEIKTDPFPNGLN